MRRLVDVLRMYLAFLLMNLNNLLARAAWSQTWARQVRSQSTRIPRSRSGVDGSATDLIAYGDRLALSFNRLQLEFLLIEG